jgi:hypothetical protein
LLTRLDPSEALLVPANAAPAFDQLRAQLRSTLVPSQAGLHQHANLGDPQRSIETSM